MMTIFWIAALYLLIGGGVARLITAQPEDKETISLAVMAWPLFVGGTAIVLLVSLSWGLFDRLLSFFHKQRTP
jgi:hypothetical protein